MSRLTEKILKVEEDIAREKGSLNLLALLQREDVADRWDLVVSASWAREDQATLRYLADSIKRHLTPREMTLLSRIVILPATEDPVRSITAKYDIEHGQVELNEPAEFGLPVKHGYIITSRHAA
jgi:hypothetical protein